MTTRAQFLDNLRTAGGPRASSPSEHQTELSKDRKSPPFGGLKANARPFTPGTRSSPASDVKTLDHLEEQLHSLHLQQKNVNAKAAQSQHLAAIYGASQGQPQGLEDLDWQAQEYLRQKQAQLMQNQLLHQQQLQHRQLQLENLRLQAASKHQAHQQQVAAQQQRMLAQIQADMDVKQPDNSFATATEQRQAAQATLQAGLRQRQAQQMYAQLLQQHQHQQQAFAQEEQDEARLRQEELLQHLRMQQFVLEHQQQQQQQQQQMQMQQQQFEQSARRERQVSNSAADTAKSWRSSSSAMSKVTAPSIIVDDSASDESEPGTASSASESSVKTPEAAEKDLNDTNNNKIGSKMAGIAALGVKPLGAPRIVSLTSAPRSRAFSVETKGASSTTSSGSSTPLGIAVQPMRQPRGPPTDIQAVNFVSRSSARTRRQAMSKLCASPRAASFSDAIRTSMTANVA